MTKGVKGAGVSALNPARNDATGIGSSITDDEGRFVLRLPVGGGLHKESMLNERTPLRESAAAWLALAGAGWR
jgi:hypothetical protein